MKELINIILPFLEKYGAGILGAVTALLTANQAGKRSIIEKEARDNLKISEAMAKAEADKPASQEALLGRLDKGDA